MERKRTRRPDLADPIATPVTPLHRITDHHIGAAHMPGPRRTAEQTERPSAMGLDARELWAAAADAGIYPPTNKDIAAYTGLQEATLSRVLSGKRNVPASMMAALMAAFPDAYDRIVRPVMPDGRVHVYKPGRTRS